MGIENLNNMDDYSPHNGDEEKRKKKEIRRRLKMIYRRLSEAEDIFNTLPSTVGYVLAREHSDNTNIPHILRWGADNMKEILDDYEKVSRKFWGRED